MDFESFKVNECPASVYYIPSFLSAQEEENILLQIENTPKPRWTQLSNRRLINYGGVPHKNGMIAEQLPHWLKENVNRVNSLGVFGKLSANHVLVNEYLPGQGIMAHLDGPLFHPIISTISCGSHAVLRFHENDALDDRKIVCQLLIEPRSLVIFKDDMYTKYLHSIDEVTSDLVTSRLLNLKYCDDTFREHCNENVDRLRRISLTIRHVPKTTKIHLRLGH